MMNIIDELRSGTLKDVGCGEQNETWFFILVIFVFLVVMQNELSYRQSLEEAIKVLHQAEIQVFTAMVNVGFSGEYESISRLHEPGEVLNLEVAMFEDTTDTNLNQLVDLVKQIASVKMSLMNLNALKVELED